MPLPRLLSELLAQDSALSAQTCRGTPLAELLNIMAFVVAFWIVCTWDQDWNVLGNGHPISFPLNRRWMAIFLVTRT